MTWNIKQFCPIYSRISIWMRIHDCTHIIMGKKNHAAAQADNSCRCLYISQPSCWVSVMIYSRSELTRMFVAHKVTKCLNSHLLVCGNNCFLLGKKKYAKNWIKNAHTFSVKLRSIVMRSKILVLKLRFVVLEQRHKRGRCSHCIDAGTQPHIDKYRKRNWLPW